MNTVVHLLQNPDTGDVEALTCTTDFPDGKRMKKLLHVLPKTAVISSELWIRRKPCLKCIMVSGTAGSAGRDVAGI